MDLLKKIHETRDAAVAEKICQVCKQPVFEEMGAEARQPGHLYSEVGIREYEISGCCEFCFDEAWGGIE